MEIVDFLKNPEKYVALGAKVFISFLIYIYHATTTQTLKNL